MRKEFLRQASLVVGGALIGSGTTYLLVKNRLTTKYDQILRDETQAIGDAAAARIDEEITSLKKLHKLPPYDTPTVLLDEPEIYNEMTGETPIVEEPTEKQQHEDLVHNLLYKATEAVNHEVHPPSQAQKIVTLEDVNASPVDIPIGNIFTDFQEPSQDLLRDKKFPYIISEEENDLPEPDYEKITLLYYADGQLADENGGMVPDIAGTVGTDSLKHFGHDEENPNTIYVRNDLRKTDFEVIRLDNTYGELVLGIAPKD